MQYQLLTEQFASTTQQKEKWCRQIKITMNQWVDLVCTGTATSPTIPLGALFSSLQPLLSQLCSPPQLLCISTANDVRQICKLNASLIIILVYSLLDYPCG